MHGLAWNKPDLARGCYRLLGLQSGLALCVGDLLHPNGRLAVELLHYGDVCHGCGRRGAVPMLLAWREPDYIPRPNPLNRAAPGADAMPQSRVVVS
jgi:hypothetical protein